jgi:uncharacterized iron-regulated membrane protein
MTKFYVLSRKLHRFLVLILTAMTLIMAASGIAIKYYWQPFGLDLGLLRYVHNQLSLIFTIALSLMALSGLCMYFFPAWKSAEAKRQNSKNGSVQ